jgi:hypothetical protein
MNARITGSFKIGTNIYPLASSIKRLFYLGILAVLVFYVKIFPYHCSKSLTANKLKTTTFGLHVLRLKCGVPLRGYTLQWANFAKGISVKR